MLRPIAVALLALFACQKGEAAQVGTAVVNGRTVILEDNNTWRYADAPGKPGGGCDRSGDIEFCVKEIGWRPIEKAGQFELLYVTPGGYYFGVVRESYGGNVGVTPDALQKAIIMNAAMGSNTTSDKIAVLAASTDVAELPGARSVVYTVRVSGIPLVYHNVFRVRDADTVQLVFWAVGEAEPPEFAAKIKDTMAKVRAD